MMKFHGDLLNTTAVVCKPTCDCFGFDGAAGIVWRLVGGLLSQRCAAYWNVVLSPLCQRNRSWILQWYSIKVLLSTYAFPLNAIRTNETWVNQKLQRIMQCKAEREAGGERAKKKCSPTQVWPPKSTRTSDSSLFFWAVSHAGGRPNAHIHILAGSEMARRQWSGGLV